jgi:hypothetical protein
VIVVEAGPDVEAVAVIWALIEVLADGGIALVIHPVKV